MAGLELPGAMRDPDFPPPPACGRIRTALQTGYLARFVCTASRCIDSCCKRYRIIHVDPPTLERHATDPVLMRHIRKKDGMHLLSTSEAGCPHLEDALCHLQMERGLSWQPEVCHYFPRKLIRLGDRLYVTSHLACNLVVEEALFGPAPFSWHGTTLPRLPAEAADLLENPYAGCDADEVFSVHERVARWLERSGDSSQVVLAKLLALSTLLDDTPRARWPHRLDDLLAHLHTERVQVLLDDWRHKNRDDLTVVYEFLQAMVGVSRRTTLGNFMGLIELIRQFLQPGDYAERKRRWTDGPADSSVEALLSRHLRARLTETLFPVNAWRTCVEEMALVAMRYCAVRLALMALLSGEAGGGESRGRDDVAGRNLAGNILVRNDVAGKNVARNDVARNDVARNDVARNDVAGKNVAGNNVARNDVALERLRATAIPVVTWVEIWLYGRRQLLEETLAREGWLEARRMACVIASC